MKDILNRNLSAMREHKPELYTKCVEILTDRETGRLVDTWQSERVFISKSVNNEVIIGILEGEREYYLNSRYDAKLAVDIWLTQLDDINYKSIIILNGISNGMYLEGIQRIIGKDNRVIVYEPDRDIFMMLVCNMDITGIIEDERIGIFVSELNLESFRVGFKAVYTYELAEFVYKIENPGYYRLYGDKINTFTQDYCYKEMQTAYVEKNTIEEYGQEMGDNILSNIWEMCKGTSINILRDEFEKNEVDFEKIPAIIVSAGPSLEKNIEDLKAASGIAFIISVDSAIPKLLSHDIVPDVIVTVDSHKPLTLFRDRQISRIPVIVCGQSRHEVLQEHIGKVIVFSGDTFMYKFFMQLGKEVEGVQTGGSVANNALSVAEYFGFRNIILVGQDLAFTDNKKHVKGIYQEREIGDEEDSEYTYVEGQDGNMLLTYANFKLYKEWFENRIVDNKELNVINATEGGALIHGAEHMTLKEAVETYCLADFDSSIIKDAPYIFADEQLEELYECLLGLRDKCQKMIDEFENGKKMYFELERLVKSGDTGSDRMQYLIKELERISNLDRKEPLIELLSMYSKKEEAEILNGMYKQNDGLDGTLSVVKDGIRILSVYQKQLRYISDKLQDVFEKEISKDMYEISEYTITFVD